MASKQKLVIVAVSYITFLFLSYTGFIFGNKISSFLLYGYFGTPIDLYVFLFATVIVLAENIFGFIGVLVTFILMHQLGRRSKLTVGKPTLYGFLLYLLTLLILIINYNQTH